MASSFASSSMSNFAVIAGLLFMLVPIRATEGVAAADAATAAAVIRVFMSSPFLPSVSDGSWARGARLLRNVDDARMARSGSARMRHRSCRGNFFEAEKVDTGTFVPVLSIAAETGVTGQH